MFTYKPRILIWDHRQPVSTPPLHRDIIDEHLWNQTSSSPGKHTGLFQTLLDKQKQNIEDPLLGQRVWRPKAIRLNYRVPFEDHGQEDYEFVLDNSFESSLTVPPTQAIRQALTEATTYYTGQIIALQTKRATLQAATPPADLSRDEITRLNTMVEDVNRLSIGSFMFLRTDTHGQWTGGYNQPALQGIKWELSAPNVPIAWRSKYFLDQDRAFTFRLRRDQGAKAQSHHEMRVYFNNDGFVPANKTTCYALVFTKDEGLYFWHFKNMTPASRLALLKRRERILDNGRLTGTEMETIANLKIAIGLAAKNRNNPSSTPAEQPDTAYDLSEMDENAIEINEDVPSADKQQIDDWKAEIKAIQDAKSGGLSDFWTQQLEDLEEILFYDRQQVRLSEDAQKLVDNSNDYTVSFHRRGFIEIIFGDGAANPWVYENKGITKTQNYATMLPGKSRLLIESNGGSWQFHYGHPLHDKVGHLWLQYFDFPYAIPDPVTINAGQSSECTGFMLYDGLDGTPATSPDLRFSLDGYGLTDTATPGYLPPGSSSLLALPGCAIKVYLAEVLPAIGVGSSAVPIPGKYQLRIDFYSKDGAYTPYLYRAEFYLLAGTPADTNKLLWDSMNWMDPSSTNWGNPTGSTGGSGPFNPYDPNWSVGGGIITPPTSTQVSHGLDIIDIDLQETENQGAVQHVRIRDMYKLPAGLPLDLEGRSVDVSLINVQNGAQQYTLTHGIIKNPRFTERAKLQQSPFHAWPGFRSQIDFDVTSLEEVASGAAPCQVIGNGKLPNVYFYELLRNIGLRDDEIKFDKVNPIAGMITGNLSHFLPLCSAGKPADIKPDLYEDTLSFINNVLNQHFNGWKLMFTIVNNFMVADLVRWIPPISERPDIRYSSVHRDFHNLSIRSLEVYQDVSDYYTSIEVRGALNPATGQRYSAKYTINEATDPSFRGTSLYYIGRDRPLVLPINEALRSDAACQMALRAYKATKMRPPYYINLVVHLNPTIHSGMVLWVDNIRIVAESIKYSSIHLRIGQLMTITGRLLDDVPILPPST
jgi:hypothetical protein